MTHSLFWFAGSFSGYEKFQPELKRSVTFYNFLLLSRLSIKSAWVLCSLHQPSEMGECSSFCCRDRGRGNFGLSDTVH